MNPPTIFGRPMERVQVGAGPAAVEYWRAQFGSFDTDNESNESDENTTEGTSQ